MMTKPTKTIHPQLFNEFDQKWEPVVSFFPQKVEFHSHFAINYNNHVLMGRHHINKIWKPINVFLTLNESKIQTQYTTRSIFSPLSSVLVAKSKNSIYLVNRRTLAQGDKHYRIDFDPNIKLSLKRWHANSHVLGIFESSDVTFTINDSSLPTDSFSSLFSPFNLGNYLKIQNIFKKKEFNKIKMISTVNSQRSIQITLPTNKIQLNENLDELFNFNNSNMITLSNGLIFISGGHQKSSFKAINNCCLLKVSSAHDRKPQSIYSNPKKVPSMLLISKNNLATVENMTTSSKSPEWMEFVKIVDFLLDPSTPVVSGIS
jgi:hypothetical protein